MDVWDNVLDKDDYQRGETDNKGNLPCLGNEGSVLDEHESWMHPPSEDLHRCFMKRYLNLGSFGVKDISGLFRAVNRCI